MHELIAPTFNFVALVIILTVLLRKPIKEMVATRRAQIKAHVDEAQAQKLEAEKRYREFSDKLRAFEDEAKQILQRATADAEVVKARILQDAQATAERIIKDAEATASANFAEYKDQIRRETIAKAVDAAERIIRDRLSTDDQRRMVTEYVGKVQQQ